MYCVCVCVCLCVCVCVCVCVCAMSHLARNILQYVTGRHDGIGGCVTAITTSSDIFQKLLVAHLVKKSSTSDGI